MYLSKTLIKLGSAVDQKQFYVCVHDIDFVRKLLRRNNSLNLSKTLIV